MMLNLNIENFKCFKDISIPLNYLTVLAGSNGNGKSSAIQSLLFLRRTVEHCSKWEKGLYYLNYLNGLNVELNESYCLNLGISSYVLPLNSDDNTISIGISNEERKLEINYSTNSGNELWLTPITPLKNSFNECAIFYQEFYYLNAERFGPRINQTFKFHDYPNTGFKGEYTAQLIHDLNYTIKIDEKRVNNDFLKGSRFIHHINSWLEYILDANIDFHYDDITHSARISVASNFSKGNHVISTNTGFGISYCLPIILTGLIAIKDRFFVIENPEAHLHPSAQSRLGYFLAIIADAGVRVIIETHSEHIVNGIQLAVATGKLNNDKSIINYLYKDDDIPDEPTIKSIDINSMGELNFWPKGFFDQSQIDYANLFKYRINNE